MLEKIWKLIVSMFKPSEYTTIRMRRHSDWDYDRDFMRPISRAPHCLDHHHNDWDL